MNTLRIDNIWNCATFNLYTVPAKSQYLKRYSTDFRNLGLSSKMYESGHLGGKFQVPRYFTFAMARWKLCTSTTFEILPTSTCTLWEQKSCFSKGIQPIFEIFASARRCWGWAFGGKFPVRMCFTFKMGRLKLRAWTRFEILPLSTCTLCQQKPNIFNGIQPIFEIFASARRC